jgi:hypothetical protein
MDKQQFVRTTSLQLLKSLSPDAMGTWGAMNGQQMVEHLENTFNMSSGKAVYPVVIPEDKLPNYRAFLFSDAPFKENTKSPALDNEPRPLRNPSMDDAIAALEKSVGEFFEYYRANPEGINSHPVFGPLQFEEWILLHHKHLNHHLRQFGLV